MINMLWPSLGHGDAPARCRSSARCPGNTPTGRLCTEAHRERSWLTAAAADVSEFKHEGSSSSTWQAETWKLSHLIQSDDWTASWHMVRRCLLGTKPCRHTHTHTHTVWTLWTANSHLQLVTTSCSCHVITPRSICEWQNSELIDLIWRHNTAAGWAATWSSWQHENKSSGQIQIH